MIERGSECRDLSVQGVIWARSKNGQAIRPERRTPEGCAAPGALAGGGIDQGLGHLAASQVRSGLPRWAEGHRPEPSTRGDAGLHQSLASVVPGHGGRGTAGCRTSRADAPPERGAEGGARDHHRGWSAGRGLRERDVDGSDDGISSGTALEFATTIITFLGCWAGWGFRAASAQAARSRGSPRPRRCGCAADPATRLPRPCDVRGRGQLLARWHAAPTWSRIGNQPRWTPTGCARRRTCSVLRQLVAKYAPRKIFLVIDNGPCHRLDDAGKVPGSGRTPTRRTAPPPRLLARVQPHRGRLEGSLSENRDPQSLLPHHG